MSPNNFRNFLEYKQNQLLSRLDELRNSLSKMDPHKLSLNTGTSYVEDKAGFGKYWVQLWGKPVIVDYPSFQAKYSDDQTQLSIINQAFLLYYYFMADGSRATDQWVSFSELPDGKFYNQAYQGYTGLAIKKAYDHQLDRLQENAILIGGIPVSFANLAFRFSLLPRVDLLLAVWEGDEDIPSSFQILFNSLISHYLPTDACAIAGSTLTRKLIRA